MKFRSLTMVFLLLLFSLVTVYAVFEMLIKLALWLGLLFVILVTGSLLLIIISHFSSEFLKGLSSQKLLRR
jgi:hypothetical protein